MISACCEKLLLLFDQIQFDVCFGYFQCALHTQCLMVMKNTLIYCKASAETNCSVYWQHLLFNTKTAGTLDNQMNQKERQIFVQLTHELHRTFNHTNIYLPFWFIWFAMMLMPSVFVLNTKCCQLIEQLISAEALVYWWIDDGFMYIVTCLMTLFNTWRLQYYIINWDEHTKRGLARKEKED